MKKQKFTDKTDIRLGFEIECVITTRDGKWRHFREKIKNLKVGITIGNDVSIRVGRVDDWDIYNTVEIRTNPMPPKTAMTVLKSIFDIVNKYGYTNSSCGLHVNISSKHKTKMLNFNPIPFLSSNLWNDILKEFKRSGNMYCRPIIHHSSKISKVNILRQMHDSVNNKYKCVTLRNFGNGTDRNSRIEIRGFGNRNYTQKFDSISNFVKRIEKLFKYSCNCSTFVKSPNI